MIEWTNVRAAYGAAGRRSLHQTLVDRIGQMIQDGALPPGMRLSEAALCEQFEVSRTPLREALKVLASEGYLVWRANRGISVAQIRVDEVRAAFEVLTGLERMIGELVCAHATVADVHSVEVMHADMVRLHAQAQREAYFRLNQAIHGRLAQLTRNPVLEDVYGSIQRRVFRARALSNTDRLRWDESVREHEQIMVALRRRNGAGLAAALAAHSQATEAVILHEVARIETETEAAAASAIAG